MGQAGGAACPEPLLPWEASQGGAREGRAPLSLLSQRVSRLCPAPGSLGKFLRSQRARPGLASPPPLPAPSPSRCRCEPCDVAPALSWQLQGSGTAHGVKQPGVVPVPEEGQRGQAGAEAAGERSSEQIFSIFMCLCLGAVEPGSHCPETSVFSAHSRGGRSPRLLWQGAKSAGLQAQVHGAWA